MEILNLSLPATNRFATEYAEQKPEVRSFFHYRYDQLNDYQERIEELKRRSFMRHELVDSIEQFMSRYPSSDKVKESLDKLGREDSVVVIGGQQAGILTGPLYSIHKIISIVILANQKEKELGVPVIPVFWIAGEDHDYQEVNHIFMEKNNELQKRTYPEFIREKKMVSSIILDKRVCLAWVEDVIASLGETEYTNQLLEFSKQAIENSTTFVDFFAYIVMELFKETGLLIVDSGDPQLRKLEKEFFSLQINQVQNITSLVKDQQSHLQELGFNNTIEISDQAANLFYYDETQQDRILLEYIAGEDSFTDKNHLVRFTKDELLTIASEHPERLSNNVVTRPLMQDLLFPTLAFIGGPGEIAYWAELKGVFENFEIKMPPIVPRLNFTILERAIETDLQDLELDLQQVLAEGTSPKRDAFLNSVRNQSLETVFRKTKDQLMANYREIEEYTMEENKGLIPLLKKNESILLKQIEFMENKVEESTKLKHQVVLNKFSRLEATLKPFGAPQERTWNVYYFLNKYGMNFINRLMELPIDYDASHKVIKL